MPTTGLICSVELEAEPLLRLLDDVERCGPGPLGAWRGRLTGEPVVLVVGGMGKTNAAHAVTLLCERETPGRLIGFGVGGAYPSTGLRVGSVALADEEIYGDEGVATPDGWASTEAIGIPLLDREGTRRFNNFPMDGGDVAGAARALERAGVDARVGPFVTVSCCSGRRDLGLQLAERHGAICETMEGAAYAHVAAIYGLPFLEVRGISNLVEDRDLGGWDLHAAAEAAARAVATVVPGFSRPDDDTGMPLDAPG